jgi:hypothetical protein
MVTRLERLFATVRAESYLVRDTTDRDRAALAFTAQAWEQFTESLR